MSLKRLAVRLLFWLLIGDYWPDFISAQHQVANHPGIPVYGKDQVRFGRDARRDEAAHLMRESGLTDSQINLGCELAHWWRKLGE